MKKIITIALLLAIGATTAMGIRAYVENEKAKIFNDGVQHAIHNAIVYNEERTAGIYYLELDGEVHSYAYDN